MQLGFRPMLANGWQRFSEFIKVNEAHSSSFSVAVAFPVS